VKGTTEVISQTNKVDLKLHRTKCAGLIKNVIAPLLEDQVKDLQDVPYSFIIDESTDNSTVKYLCICVKYHSKIERCIKTKFLGTYTKPGKCNCRYFIRVYNRILCQQ
jgi:hypothetical protein